MSEPPRKEEQKRPLPLGERSEKEEYEQTPPRRAGQGCIAAIVTLGGVLLLFPAGCFIYFGVGAKVDPFTAIGAVILLLALVAIALGLSFLRRS